MKLGMMNEMPLITLSGHGKSEGVIECGDMMGREHLKTILHPTSYGQVKSGTTM